MHNLKRRFLRRGALLAAFALVVAIMPFDFAGQLTRVSAGPAPVESYFIPLPEEDVRGGSLALYGSTSDTIHTVISITGAVDGTIVYYDHWEDGFELDIANPVQASSEIWGDGLYANGAPPGCLADGCDSFDAGDNAALINDVPANPRDQLDVFYDGGDQVATTGPVAVTRAGWATDPGTLLAGAVEVYPTDAWGTSYTVPMGEDSAFGQNFEYTAASIMAASPGTTVSVDVDGDTVIDQTLNLGAGESSLVGGLNEGAVISANGPLQVDMLTGDVGATYAGRWFALLPTSQWATSYYNPVGTVDAGHPSTVVLYNPTGSELTVTVDHQTGVDTVAVPANGAESYQMPGSGAQFSAIDAFYATVLVDFGLTTSDWGFTLVPETKLSTAAVVGWGPGSNDLATENSSPVWVTTDSATTVYVDYDGDPSTGVSQDVNGDWYDVALPMVAYQMERLYDSSDNDQTGLKVYTLDGTRVAVAYGQDPSTASGGVPALDLGTAVVPLVLVAMGKIGSLTGDSNGNGVLDAGEYITYTVTIRNDGTAEINPSIFTDDLDPNTTYVAGTTMVDGVGYADAGTTPFPFDEGGQDLGNIVPGQLVVITYDVQLNDPLPDGVDSVVNNAQLNSIGISITGTSTQPVFDPILRITKTSDVPTEGAIPGGLITYTLLVENISDTPQDQFSVVDVVPQGTTYVAGSTSVTGQVTASDTYADDMESGGYGGSTGSLFWAPDWTEVNESDGVNAGDERSVSSGDSLRLRVQDNDGGGEGLARAVNLAGYDTATLSFDFARSGFDNTDDWVALQATDDGSTWVELARWEGPGSDPLFLNSTHNLDAYLTASAGIRFITSPNLGGSDRFMFDNVVVSASTQSSTTATNGAGGTLADGDAPNLVVPADPFTLDPYQSFTVTFQVQVDSPLIPDITELPNIARVSSAQQPVFTDDSITDPVAFPEIELTKTLLSNADEDGSADVSVGDTLTYQFVADNVGDTALSDVTITDPMVGLSALTCGPPQPAVLQIGEALTCTATYTVTQSDVNASRIDNTATVAGNDPAARPVTDDSTETVPINPVPAVTLSKSLLTDLAGTVAGTVFDYDFVITNTGNVDLSDIALGDPMLGGAIGCPQDTLAPYESMTCNASYTVTQGDVDAGQVANTATVTAIDPSSTPLLDSDDELAILEQNASINLDKAIQSNADEDASGSVSLGDTLTYEFTATNDGNVTLNNVIVVDPLSGLSALSCLPVAGSSLAPAAQMTCTATYSVVQADVDAGLIENTASVTGSAVNGSDVSDTADESVATSQNPSITLTKSFTANADEDTSGDISLNDTLTYTFDIVNDGNVTLTVVTLTDPLPGLSAFACAPDTLPITMAPGATVSCTATYSVVQGDVDAGRIDNTATASGLQPNGLPISDDDDETVFADRNPSIDLAKSLFGNADEDASGDVSLGDTLTYQFVATNDGDVGLDNVAITDPLDGLSALSCTPAVGSSLAPTEAMTCAATYSVTQADIDLGEVVNTATAIGDDSGGGGSVSDTDGVTISTAQNPSISLSKSLTSNADEDGSGDVSVGDTLTYDLVVTNEGDVSLSSIAVSDPLAGGAVACPQTTLPPAGTMTCQATYTVVQGDVDAGSISNTATVAGEDPSGTPVGDTDNELVSPPQNPSIVIVKSLQSNADEDGSSGVSTGDTLTYQFTATNDGDVTLDLVVIADPLPGMSPLTCIPAAGASLAVGGSMNCLGTYVVTQADADGGSIDNTASVVSERPGGDPGDSSDDVGDSDDHSVVIPARPEINLDKSLSGNADEDTSGTVTVGDTLSYEFVVTNTGNVTLINVGVTDPLIGTVSCPTTTLAPADSTTCTGTYVVALTDADAGFVINTAVAEGTDPNGTNVTDDDAIAEPVITAPAITLTKTWSANADEDGSGGVSIGDTLTYDFVATNTGDVTLSASRIVDPKAGLSVLSCLPAVPAVLVPGDSITCSATYTVTQTDIDNGQIINTATAEGVAPDSTLVSDTDDEQLLVAQTASISLNKTVAGNADEDGSGGVTLGDTLTYQFEATNTGNVTLSSVAISDPLPGLGALSCVPPQPAVLSPGSSIVCTADYVVVQADVDASQIANTATVNAVDPDSAPVNDTDSLITPIEGSPTINLDKYLAGNADEDGSGDVSVGDTLTYQFDVENTGDVSLTSVTVTDPLPGLSAISCSPAQGSTLAPTETMSCSATYVVTTTDSALGQIVNTATVVGLAPANTPTSDDDTETVLTARADLSLFKAASDTTPNVGDTVTYILTLVNDGPDSATNVEIVDVLPSGIQYQAGTIAGGNSQDASGDPTLTWDVITIASGASLNLTYSATVLMPTGASDEYLNVAEVTASSALDPDSTPGNDDGDQSEDDEVSESLTPQSADLSLVKTISDATPNVGDTITFTITVSNAGPNDATGVAVSDLVPDGYGSISNISADGSLVGSTVSWSGLSVVSGGTTVVTFDAVVASPAADYSNTAEVTASDQLDPDSTPDNDDGDQSEDDEDAVGSVPQQADLSLAKTVSDTTPNVGDTVTFTVTVSNAGPDAATGVAVVDTVPAGYSTISNVSGSGSAAGSSVTWSGLSIASGASAVLTFDAVVAVPSGAVDEYLNVVEVTASDQFDPDSAPDNDDGDQSEGDEDAIAVVPQQADLSLVKGVSDTTPLVGEIVTFTLTVNNAGPDDATGVALSDLVPNGYASISNVSDGGSAVGNVVSWTGLAVAAGGSTSVTFDAEVQAPPAAFINMAQVTASDQFDPDSTPNNDDGDQSEDDEDNAGLFPTVIDLSLAKAVSDATPDVGDTVTFNVTVSNAGPDDATAVTVVDTVPAGFSAISNVSGSGSAVASTVTWSGLALASGGSVVLTFDAVVDAPSGAADEYVNVVEATAAAQHDSDSTPGNDDGDQSEDDEDAVSVDPQQADLSLAKTVSDGTPNVGDTVTFTVTVSNAGPDAATGVTVVDAVPAGFSAISNVSGSGSAVGSTVSWSGLSVVSGGSVTLTFDAVVDAPTGAANEYENVVEITAADQFDPDSTPNNDDGDQSEDDEDSVSVVPQQADLSLTKTVSDGTPNVGDTVTFTVTVSNAGPDAATGVTVVDAVPAGFSAISNVSGSGSAVGSTVSWSGLSVVSGGSVTLTFDAVVDAPTGAANEYENVVEIAAADQFDPDSTPNNDDGDQSEDDEDSASVAPQQADLSLVKTLSDNTPVVGQTITFTLTISNDGPDNATGVAIEDAVPNGYTSVGSISDGGTYSGGTVSWSGLSVASGGSIAVTFEAEVQAPPAVFLNMAEVTASDQYDPDSTPDNDDGDQSEDDEDNAGLFPTVADLSLAKTVSDATPNVGDTVTFTVTVSNAGPDAATGVTVADSVPVGYSAISNVSGSGSAVASTVSWSGLAIASGGSVVLTFDAVVDAPTGAADEYENVAEVTAADQFDPDSTPDNDDGDQSEDDEDAASVVPQQADLSLAKTVSDGTPNVGDTVTFTVTVSNAGPDAATGVNVVDTVPAGFSAISNVSGSGSAVGSTVTWSGLVVASGDSVVLTFDAVVEAPAADFANVAEVTASHQFDPDSAPGNDDGDQSEDDEDSAAVVPQQADLSLTKTVSDATPNVGDTVTFTVTVANSGPAAADNVTVADSLPSGFTYAPATISGGDSNDDSSAPVLAWTVGSLPSGGSAALSFDAVVLAPTGSAGEYVNVVEVTAVDQFDPDSAPGNDDGDQSEDDENSAAVVPQQADLSLTKSVSDSTPNVGDTVVFTVIVSNAGPDDATGVAVTDSVPDGYSALSNVSSGGSVAGSTVSWSGIAISSGGSVVLTFDAVVDAPTGAPTEYVNVVEVTAVDQFDPDSAPGNDDGDQSEDDEDATAVVPQQADLSLIKTVSAATPNVGDTVTFTIVVTNDGPDDASGVAVTDSVPDGFGAVSNVSSGGVAEVGSIVWSGLSVSSGTSVTLTFDAMVDVPPAGYANTAEITAADQFDPDSSPANDDGDQSEDDEDVAAVIPQAIDLSLTKSVDDAAPPLGSTVTYSIVVANDGSDDATGVEVADQLPSGLTGVAAISDGGILTGSTITWSGLAIASGSSLMLTFEASPLPPAGVADEYANTAQITAADQFDVDSTPANDDGDQSEDDEDLATISPATIGLAKAVSTVVNHGDGTYAVTYLLTVENLGTVTLADLTIADDIAGQFGSLSPTGFSAIDGTLVANVDWDGTPASNVLASGQSLDPGASATVSIAFVATPGAAMGPHDNTASVTGITPSGSVVIDQSTDGIDPDADGDDGDGTIDSDDVPEEDDPTPVSFGEAPLLGLAKDLASDPVSHGNGTFDVTFAIVVENLGDVALGSIQVSDDLDATFAAAESWSIASVTSTTLSVSSGFDGQSDINLLTGDDTLPAGEIAAIEITVTVTPGAELGPYLNSAAVSGVSPAGTTVGDLSQDGVDADPDGNGDPTDNNDPTPVTFPPLGSVSGMIWGDADADAAIDATETGLPGVTVELVDPGADGEIGGGDDIVVATTVTGPDGSYAFIDVPPGVYIITVDPASLPLPMTATYDPDLVLDYITLVSILPGEETTDRDFGQVAGFNLVLTKTVEGDVQRGALVDFVITVTNEGPATALGPITVTDVVPDELPVVAVAHDDGWDCTSGQELSCTLEGDLEVDESSTIRVTTSVNVGFGEQVTNTAIVAASGPVAEVDLSDNTDSAAVAVDELPRTGADLVRFATIGFLLLAAGISLVGLARRREAG